jgi:hypothetical protein
MKTTSYFNATAWLLILLPFSPLFFGEPTFLRFDDDVNFVSNDRIQTLSWDNFFWMLKAGVLGVYEPVSWLFKALLISVFGLSAKTITNATVVVHILNCYLLFFCTKAILVKVLPEKSLQSIALVSGVVALMFAVHPLRVEVVAWASGQSYAVGAFFTLLALRLYLHYCERVTKNDGSYRLLIIIIGIYICGVLGKSAMVMFPVWLVLIDWFVYQRRSVKAIVMEKLPFVVIMLAAVVIVSQVNVGVTSSEHFTLNWPDKIGRAVLALAIYPIETVWPTNLTPHYTMPHWDVSIFETNAILVFLVLLSLCFFSLRMYRSNPWPTVVIVAYSSMLLPVLGFIQHGFPTLVADRYTYIATIPFFIAIAAIVLIYLDSLYQKISKVGIIVGFFLLVCLSYRQVTFWMNDFSLWERALEVQPYNAFAGNNLGYGYWLAKDYESARKYLERAYSYEPFNKQALMNLGITYYELDRCDKAVELYSHAARTFHANYADLHNNLGNCYIRLNKLDLAIREFEIALQLNPNHSRARRLLEKTHRYLKQSQAM